MFYFISEYKGECGCSLSGHIVWPSNTIYMGWGQLLANSDLLRATCKVSWASLWSHIWSNILWTCMERTQKVAQALAHSKWGCPCTLQKQQRLYNKQLMSKTWFSLKCSWRKRCILGWKWRRETFHKKCFYNKVHFIAKRSHLRFLRISITFVFTSIKDKS